ncbi:hypothetical protein REPUB_Repub01dG0271700 [Reevesia pubescens]
MQKEVFKAVKIDTRQPPYVFKCLLYYLTGVPPERQKIMVKEDLLKDDADWSSVGVKQRKKLMMMVTADEVFKASERELFLLKIFQKKSKWVIGSGFKDLVYKLGYQVFSRTYYCLLKLKSSSEEDVIKMQPGSNDIHLLHVAPLAPIYLCLPNPFPSLVQKFALIFFSLLYYMENFFPDILKHSLPDGLGDDLIVEVHDSKGQYCGHKLLEVAMKIHHVQQRNLLLYGPWKWLVDEFASHYGVSDAYTKLRYGDAIGSFKLLSFVQFSFQFQLQIPYVMVMATPRTALH